MRNSVPTKYPKAKAKLTKFTTQENIDFVVMIKLAVQFWSSE